MYLCCIYIVFKKSFPMYLVSIGSIWDQNMDPIGPLENPKIGSWRGPRGSKIPKNAEKRENWPFWGIWGPDPKIPENVLKLSTKLEKCVIFKHRTEKKVQNFPEICQKMAKKGHFSGVLRGAETTKMGKVPPDPPEFRWAFVRPRT